MLKRNLFVVALVFFAGLTLFYCTEEKGENELPGSGNYADLVSLFKEFREFQQPERINGVPDYTKTAMEKQGRDLKKFQDRLAAIDPRSWPVSEQVDYHLVRAEMNGLEFRHRVLRPWSRNPWFYASMMARMLRIRALPVPAEDVAGVQTNLQAIPEIVRQAEMNLGKLSDVPGDLAILAIHDLEENSASYQSLAAQLEKYHPDLVSDAQGARNAIEGFLDWLKKNKGRMTASAGVGKENYNWLLKNVYLIPYTWEECRNIVELEDNRVITFMKLEENRNRNLPPLKPVTSQEEYKKSVEGSIDHLMKFLRDAEIFTVQDYLVPDGYGAWHEFDKPWPKKPDYFFNFSHREPLMEETHEMVGHYFDGLRVRHDNRPIRGVRRLYKVSTARGEGQAFALEELLMHAGYLDGRPRRGREITYQQAAFRTVRALSDLYMHSGDWSLTDAMKYCVENAPRGDLLENSPHLWNEMRTTLVGVGHHMLMVVGKVQFMKLLRDRAQQQGDEFTLKNFMDEFYQSGMIPFSLIRWEMTGYDDEIKKLW